MRYSQSDDPNLPPVQSGEHPHHYDPNQPRVPPGHEGGGRWTSGGYTPESKVQFALRGPSGSGLLPIALQRAIEAGILSLYAHLSRYNSRYYRTVLEAQAREYAREGAPGGEFSDKPVRVLTQPQVQKTCKQLEIVQGLIDTAVLNAKQIGAPMSANQYGTEVHWQVATAIGKMDPRFIAELSLRKMAEEGASAEEIEEARRGGIKYGTKGSIRVDVLERADEETVCVYDIKTGNAGLSHARFLEILANVRSIYGGAKRIIITEVRPTDPWRPNPR